MKKSSKAQGSSSNPIVRIYWGDILFDTILCEPGDPVTIGREQGSTLVMDLGRGATAAKIPLVSCNSDATADLVFDKKMEGQVRIAGKLHTLEKLRGMPETEKTTDGLFKFRLTQKDTASIVVGYVSFDITWSKTHSLIPRPIMLDRRAMTFTTAIGISMVVLFTLFTVPEVEVPEDKPPERIVEIIPPKILRPKPPGEAPPPAGDASAQAAAEAPKPPTAAEKLKSADLSNLASSLSSIGANVAAPAVKNREVATEQTPSQSFSASAVASTNTQKASIGQTQGAGEGGFAGTGQLGLAGNSGLEGGTGTTLGGTGTDGGEGLDRQVIDQIVRRRQDRIRLCYERQLNFSPGLAGKVTVQFTIHSDGSVAKSLIIEDTMKNTSVNDCISSEVKSWTFPRPKGGAMVKVDYPFVFESGGTQF